MRNLIIANWKCNPTSREEAENLFDAIKTGVESTNAEVVVCPPFVYLFSVAKSVGGFGLGAQNVFWEEKGAFTGEISGAMLKDLGVKYVIVGHSERRKYFGETDETVNKKMKAVLKAGLSPILCIGETAEQKEAGETEAVLKTQLTTALDGVSASELGENFAVAYEPVWAISGGDPYKTKELPTPEKVETINNYIRSFLPENTRILYGGSSNAKNAKEYLDVGVQGFLVGGASLRPDDFSEMVKLAE